MLAESYAKKASASVMPQAFLMSSAIWMFEKRGLSSGFCVGGGSGWTGAGGGALGGGSGSDPQAPSTMQDANNANAVDFMLFSLTIERDSRGNTAPRPL